MHVYYLLILIDKKIYTAIRILYEKGTENQMLKCLLPADILVSALPELCFSLREVPAPVVISPPFCQALPPCPEVLPQSAAAPLLCTLALYHPVS